MPIDTSKVRSRLAAAIDQGMQKLAKKSAQNVRNAAPVGSAHTGDDHPGELKNSIHEVLDNQGFKIVADSDHAAIVEYGTVHNKPRPYMRPEFNRLRSEGIRDLAAFVKQAMGG